MRESPLIQVLSGSQASIPGMAVEETGFSKDRWHDNCLAYVYSFVNRFKFVFFSI